MSKVVIELKTFDYTSNPKDRIVRLNPLITIDQLQLGFGLI